MNRIPFASYEPVLAHVLRLFMPGAPELALFQRHEPVIVSEIGEAHGVPADLRYGQCVADEWALRSAQTKKAGAEPTFFVERAAFSRWIDQRWWRTQNRPEDRR